MISGRHAIHCIDQYSILQGNKEWVRERAEGRKYADMARTAGIEMALHLLLNLKF
jgi:hypothetical protein